jgi:hypothetical protein
MFTERHRIAGFAALALIAGVALHRIAKRLDV